MDVFSVSVRFARKVQAAQYEPVDGEVTLSANLHSGDDVGKAAQELMDTARLTVINGLRGGPTVKTGDAAAPTAAANTGSASVDSKATEAAPARRGGRKAVDKTDATQTASAAVATTETTDAKIAGAAPADNIRSGAEDRVDPNEIPDDTATAATTAKPVTAAATVASEIPDDPKPAPAATTAAPATGSTKLTADDLQSFITKTVQQKKVPVTKIKEILAQHGVSRTSEIPEADLQTVKDEIEMAALA
jgi:hypothetical protein